MEKKKTIWTVTEHNPATKKVEFVRFTPQENVVKITIQLKDNKNNTTTAQISYQYTALNEEQNRFIEQELDTSFKNSMQWWEKAINYYLLTGEKLLNKTHSVAYLHLVVIFYHL